MMGALRRRLPAARYPALALATLALLVLGGRAFHDVPGSARSSGPVAPGFALERLDGGGTVDLADYSGQPVVLTFWASWCGPCKDEMGPLERAWKRWSQRGVQLIGVDSRDSADAAKAFVERYGITFPIAVDPAGETALQYGLPGMPETVVISGDGQVVSRIIGPVTEERLDGALRTI
jgi:cytochrome c biogenesis protein CcmG/thiol:disulfide interchange protein DsbE